jgi:hypothetical protein
VWCPKEIKFCEVKTFWLWMIEGVNLTKMYCKHFCKCHNEPWVQQTFGNENEIKWIQQTGGIMSEYMCR